eukprot:2973533-Prymnesium_polylepis.1
MGVESAAALGWRRPPRRVAVEPAPATVVDPKMACIALVAAKRRAQHARGHAELLDQTHRAQRRRHRAHSFKDSRRKISVVEFSNTASRT